MAEERLLAKTAIISFGYDPLRLFQREIRSKHKHKDCKGRMASIVSYNIKLSEKLGFFSLMPIDINAKCDCGKVYEHGDKI